MHNVFSLVFLIALHVVIIATAFSPPSPWLVPLDSTCAQIADLTTLAPSGILLLSTSCGGTRHLTILAVDPRTDAVLSNLTLPISGTGYFISVGQGNRAILIVYASYDLAYDVLFNVSESTLAISTPLTSSPSNSTETSWGFHIFAIDPIFRNNAMMLIITNETSIRWNPHVYLARLLLRPDSEAGLMGVELLAELDLGQFCWANQASFDPTGTSVVLPTSSSNSSIKTFPALVFNFAKLMDMAHHIYYDHHVKKEISIMDIPKLSPSLSLQPYWINYPIYLAAGTGIISDNNANGMVDVATADFTSGATPANFTETLVPRDFDWTASGLEEVHIRNMCTYLRWNIGIDFNMTSSQSVIIIQQVQFNGPKQLYKKLDSIQIPVINGNMYFVTAKPSQDGLTYYATGNGKPGEGQKWNIMC